jgi:hypothetical protein
MTEPQTYRKTATIQALPWDPANPRPVLDWLEANGCHYKVLDNGRLGVGTLESGTDVDRHTAGPGDLVAHGAVGEFWIIRKDVFAQTYVAA